MRDPSPGETPTESACDCAAQREREDVVPRERLDRTVDVCGDHDGACEPGWQPPGRVGEKEMDERATVEIERGLEGGAEEPREAGQ